MKIYRNTIRNRRVTADTDVQEEALDLLFEAEDVANLVSQVSGEDVDVTVDGDTVEFDVGDETYTCSAEPSTEIVESTRVNARRRVSGPATASRRVSASTVRRPAGRPAGRTVRRVPYRK